MDRAAAARVALSEIVELSWLTATIPLAHPLQAGNLSISERGYCCVKATLSAGAVGEAFVLTRGLDVDRALGHLVAPLVIGSSAEEGFHRLRVGLRNVGWDGAISRAASAVLLAAFDALGHEAGSPIWRLLGGTRPPAHEAVVAIGYTPLGEDPGAGELREAETAAELGARTVKLMGGFGPPETDIARVDRIRRTIDGLEVALDVNGAWSIDTAAQMLPQLAAAGVAFVEEPWPYELGIAGFVRISGVAPRPPLAFGEVSASTIELETLAASGVVDFLRPDATLLGGPTPFLSIQRAAEDNDVALLPHFWPEVHRHLMSTYEGEAVLEVALPGGGGLGLEEFVEGRAVVEDGRVRAQEGPGFGYRLDWSSLAHRSERGPSTLTYEPRRSSFPRR